ncbi:MAG: M48 family metallopeptidase [Candidatus Micrarchaeia archaeon]
MGVIIAILDYITGIYQRDSVNNTSNSYKNDSVLINGVAFKTLLVEVIGNTISARLKEDTIIIRVPRKLNNKAKIKVAERIKSKLIKKLEQINPTELNLMKNSSLIIKDNSKISLLGQSYDIKLIRSQNNRSKLHITSNLIEIFLSKNVLETNLEKEATKIFKKRITKTLLPKIKEMANQINKSHYNYEFNNISIHNQNTLWGSYGRRTRNIYLSFKLLLAPEDVIKYVIIHELSHIPFSSHSKSFWANVSKACPDYKEKVMWLKKNGNKLGLNYSS